MAAINQTALSSANWMAYLPDRTRLFDVVMPGSHGAATFGYTSGDLNSLDNRFVQSHDTHSDFSAQFQQGIRYMDLRVRKVSDTGLGSNIQFFHGRDPFSFYLKQGLSDALTAAQTFLQANPTETVVLTLKREDGPAETATTEIDSADLEAYLAKFATNAKLPASNNSLWVTRPSDFQAIREARNTNGLADLNKSGSGYELSTDNPRLVPGSKLNYENLTLGDVRGKILLHLREIGGGDGFNNSPIVALDQGTYTSGIYFQDNYNAPDYAVKKNDIIRAAKGDYPNDAAGGNLDLDKKYSLNFTSAASALVNAASSPASFALTINAGLPQNNFQTENSTFWTTKSPSLKTMLSKNGELQKWNLAEQRAGRPGLRGTIAGDFYLTPQSWYSEFWGGSGYSRRGLIPNPNSKDYSPDDHITRLIWSQNSLYGVSFANAVADSLTGLPVFRESQKSTINFIPYSGNLDQKGINFSVTQVSAAEAGLSAQQIAAIKVAPLTDPVSFHVERTSRGTAQSIISTFNTDNRSVTASLAEGSPKLAFTSVVTPNQVNGYYFFRLDFLNPGDNVKMEVPTFFAVTDTF
jgi:hypothetical protein